jgi:hypothetical protein
MVKLNFSRCILTGEQKPIDIPVSVYWEESYENEIVKQTAAEIKNNNIIIDQKNGKSI